ncbi:MAG TPA: zinc-ribbon domain-containing protein [Pyrinomonadaceae bacterium]
MLCPNCGTKTTTEHKFCRNCGMNLEPVARALAAHLSVGGAAAARASREADRSNVRRLTVGLFTGVFVVIFGMLLIAFLPGKAFKMLGLIAAALGIVFSLVSVLSSLRRMSDAAVEATPPPALDQATPTGRLLHEQTFDPIPSSVTDHTTELLHVEPKERRARD